MTFDEVLELLRQHQVAKVVCTYWCSGDDEDEVVDSPEFYSVNGDIIDPSVFGRDLGNDFLEEFVFDLLEHHTSWRSEEGSTGTYTLDVRLGTHFLQHEEYVVRTERSVGTFIGPNFEVLNPLRTVEMFEQPAAKPDGIVI